MPKLWSETIGEHRTTVREAVIDATGRLVAAAGLRAVTMSAVAEGAGIGRATLYKYFPDADAVLEAWHARLIRTHLNDLRAVTEHTEEPERRLPAVLERYATLVMETGPAGDAELSRGLHGSQHGAAAESELHALLHAVLNEGVSLGTVRDDVPVGELAAFCLSALAVAPDHPSTPALRRRIEMTLAGIRPPAVAGGHRARDDAPLRERNRQTR